MAARRKFKRDDLFRLLLLVNVIFSVDENRKYWYRRYISFIMIMIMIMIIIITIIITLSGKICN